MMTHHHKYQLQSQTNTQREDIKHRERNNNETATTVIISVLFFEQWHAVLQLVEALRYKPEGRGLDSRWCH